MARLAALLLCHVLLLACSAADEQRELRIYKLGDQGSLQLEVPESWKEAAILPPPRSGVVGGVIQYGPETPGRWAVNLSPIWNYTAPSPPVASELREEVVRIREGYSETATNPNIAIREVTGKDATLFYFSIEIADPGPDDFTHMTQGIAGIGELMVPFSIASDGQRRQLDQDVIEMLRTGRHQTSPLPPPAEWVEEYRRRLAPGETLLEKLEAEAQVMCGIIWNQVERHIRDGESLESCIEAGVTAMQNQAQESGREVDKEIRDKWPSGLRATMLAMAELEDAVASIKSGDGIHEGRFLRGCERAALSELRRQAGIGR